jgi:hypothetical protein
MSKPFYVTLPRRGLIHLEGEDRVSFLQGLVSNDVEKVAGGAIQYSCLLTPQGKFLHDFFVHAGDGFLLLDCEGGARGKDLYDRLNKFRLRAKVKISLEEDNPVYAVFDADEGLPDPRSEVLGRRTFEKPALDEQPFEEWDRRRIAATIPDGSRDMELEKSTLLEAHIDKLHGLDWNKGCYMGQELTARMHYRGLAKKHLYTVTFKDTAPAPFSDLPNGGQMRSFCGDIGIALLKDGDPTCL